MISEFLFFEENSTKDEKSCYVGLKIEIRELIKEDFNRKVLTEILLDLRKDVSGETQKRLFQLYQDLGLHQDAFLKLKSWRWEVVSKAIYELTQMQVAESYSFITKFINDKRGTIRKQAEIAIVTLKNEGINHFLDTTEYRISEWQQLKLLDVIRNQDDFQPPRFKAWLTSSNKHVVLFALRLIKHYNQNDAFASLVELIKHRNNQIKKATISCIKEFNAIEALHTLKLVFWKSSVDIKISILDAVAELGTKDDLDFLKSIEKKESNFSVKSKAISSINSIAPESIMPTRGIVQIKGSQIPDDVIIEDVSDVEHQIEEVDMQHIEEPYKHDEEVELIKEKKQSIVVDDKTEVDMEKTKDESLENNETPVKFDFLPLVVDNNEKNELESIATQNDDAVNENQISDDINGLNVVFEEVVPTTSITNPETSEEKEVIETASNDGFSNIELEFLPVVIDDVLEEDTLPIQNEDSNIKDDDTEIGTKEVLKEEDIDVEFAVNIENTAALDFLPIVSYDEMENNNESKPLKTKIEDVSNYEVEYEEILLETHSKHFSDISEEFMEWPIEVVDKEETAESSFIPIDSEEYETNEDEINSHQEIKDILDFLPKPKYHDGETIITMRLLDDIEELGDQREIPLLKELLSQTNKEIIRDRIEDIVQKFLINEPKNHSMEIIETVSDEFKPFSVFEDLFRTCDTASKLILMDEIVAVGDEKEIDFLNNLLKDPKKKIRERAKTVLKGLQNRLFQESLCFELSGAFVNNYSNNAQIDERKRNSIINQLFAIPNKIIEKLNG